jgi:2-oxoglutarate dehydrogenase E2 component (dihydrolipoamide succinyltransferase)
MTDEAMVDVVMPQMGVSVTEGVVARWLVSVGDQVTNDQLVCEISTDKTDAEILAPADGIIVEIVVLEGDSVEVGNPVARMALGNVAETFEVASVSTAPEPISRAQARPDDPPSGRLDSGESRAKSDHTSSRLATSRKSTSQPEGRSVSAMLSGATIDADGAADAALDRPSMDGRPLSSPLAQRRASERNIDLRTVKGTGRRGRICVHDVLSASRGSEMTSARLRSNDAIHGGGDVPLGYEDVPFQVVATSPHRRAISEHMLRSRQTSAHMTTEVDVDMFQVAKVRDLMNGTRNATGQGRISYLSFIAKAAVSALGEFPDMNATFQHERVLLWDEVNLGIAVDTPAGLIVPVIRHAEGLTVEQIADGIAQVAERARARKLVPDDLRAGTFTISNPGSLGAVSAPAIINQPQVAILGIPVIVKRLWVVSSPEGAEAVAIRPILRLAVTFDHRAIDGAYATRYAVAVKQHLEEWSLRDYT